MQEGLQIIVANIMEHFHQDAVATWFLANHSSQGFDVADSLVLCWLETIEERSDVVEIQEVVLHLMGSLAIAMVPTLATS